MSSGVRWSSFYCLHRSISARETQLRSPKIATSCGTRPQVTKRSSNPTFWSQQTANPRHTVWQHFHKMCNADDIHKLARCVSKTIPKATKIMVNYSIDNPESIYHLYRYTVTFLASFVWSFSEKEGSAWAWDLESEFPSFWGTTSSGSRTTQTSAYNFLWEYNTEHLLALSMATGSPRCRPRSMMMITINFESGPNAPENA